jgi:hypothetical protein
MRGHFNPSIEMQGGTSASGSANLLCHVRAFVVLPTVQTSNVVQIPLCSQTVCCDRSNVPQNGRLSVRAAHVPKTWLTV